MIFTLIHSSPTITVLRFDNNCEAYDAFDSLIDAFPSLEGEMSIECWNGYDNAISFNTKEID